MQSMSYVRVWIHAVWGTKDRTPCLSKDVREELFSHIKENAKVKGICIDRIGGHLEHIHCLIALNADTSIAKTIQLIKGESAKWGNENNLTKQKLEWAHEYFAISVSESQLDIVRAYIDRQEEHHKKVTYQEEYEKFLERYGFAFQN